MFYVTSIVLIITGNVCLLTAFIEFHFLLPPTSGNPKSALFLWRLTLKLWKYLLPHQNFYLFVYFIIQSLFLLIMLYLWLLGAPSNCFSFDHWELLQTGSCGLFDIMPVNLKSFLLFQYDSVLQAHYCSRQEFIHFSQAATVPFRGKWYLDNTVWPLGVPVGLIIASRSFAWAALETYIYMKISYKLILIFPIQTYICYVNIYTF